MRNEQATTLVVALLLQQRGRLLLVQQQGTEDAHPSWALPGGVVEAGELLLEALRRELREECGLEVLEIGRLL